MNLIKRANNAINGLTQFKLEEEFNISKTFADILVARGYDNSEKIKEFLNPNINNIPSPYLFNDMNKAVNIIKEYGDNKKNIIIYGDYDVDGVSAVSILVKEFYKLGYNFKCYIPDRHNEGYGLNKNAILKLKNEKNADLIITVDCGITNIEEIDYAHSLGIKIVITDHHTPKEILPNADAIIDAKVIGETYPYKDLCGAGIAGILGWGITNDFNSFYNNIDLITLATVADLVPLTEHNRAIVKEGLKCINSNPSIAITALKKQAGINDNIPLTSYALSYKIAPIINACGRLNSANLCVIMLVDNDVNKVNAIASKVNNEFNIKRREIESNIFIEADKMLQSININKSIVLYSEHWESGVIGIVASKLVEKYNVPTILLTYDSNKDIYVGSARSINGINIFEILSQCSEYLAHFGGHTAAAGLSVKKECINDFINKFNLLLNRFDEKIFIPSKYYDLEVEVKDLCKEMIKEFAMLEPTGMNNPKPVLLLHDVEMKNIVSRGKDNQHFSSFVFDKTGKVEAIAFNHKYPENIKYFNCLVSPSINLFESDERFQVVISYLEECYHSENKLYDEKAEYSTRVIPKSLGVLGINSKKESQFNKAGIHNIKDLLEYFPKKYLDFRRPKLVSEIKQKETCAIVGTIRSVKTSNKKVSMVYCMCTDEAGQNFMVSWFNQDYVYRMLTVGKQYIFCGQAKILDSGLLQITPQFFDSNISKLKKIVPVYKKIQGMSNDFLVNSIDSALEFCENTDYLSREIVEQFNLLCTFDTIKNLHNPVNDSDISNAQRRMIFDELFKFNLILKYKQLGNEQKCPYKAKTHEIWKKLLQKLPYSLTIDQKETLKKICYGMNKETRLNALVQGDVGSGKTIIAIFALALAAENHFQGCLIAPTTVLAKQHFEACVDLLQPLGVRIAYLAGTTKAKEKKTILKLLAEGEIDVVIGTHAVIQDSVVFKDLGLVIVDEQHRFGVSQREKLLCNDREKQPHLITMSATPIPRTLCMATFGNSIEVMNIKTKPAGRKDVITMQMTDNNEIYQFMYNEIKNGHQAYIVCPLIDESESDKMNDVESVASAVKTIKEYFDGYPDVKISDISGKMKQEEINEEIDKFARQETNILISTTIIEVGVNVPNATVMVIKSSERFGLAQAHQLRGRVGRGDAQSYCILQTNKDDAKANILCSTNDGFEIAKHDLLMRGPGDFIGTVQTGDNKTIMLMMSEPDLNQKIVELVNNIYEDKSLYSRFEYIVEDHIFSEENN